jgi:O-antigen/teichoic acid export membrane protein
MALDSTNSNEGLGKKAVKGSIWLSSSSLLTRLLGACRLLILAMLLPQAELGLFGISMIAMRFIEQLSETGMRQALIQKQGEVDDYLGTAWVAQIVRGFCIGLVIWVSATSIENFFGKEGIADLLRWLAIMPVMQGFFNFGFVLLYRELSFNKIVIHTTTVSLVDILFSILFAWIWPIALSLVFGKLLSIAVGIVVSFGIERRRASFSFSPAQFRELYRFGFWIFLSAILSFTMISGGDLVIGKILPVESLAIYQVAYSLACIPLMQMMAVIATTTYSALSRIQNDQPRMVSAFLRVFALA